MSAECGRLTLNMRIPNVNNVVTIPSHALPTRRMQQSEQLHDLKAKKISEKEFHEKQIKDLEEAVQRHKKNLKQLKK